MGSWQERIWLLTKLAMIVMGKDHSQPDIMREVENVIESCAIWAFTDCSPSATSNMASIRWYSKLCAMPVHTRHCSPNTSLVSCMFDDVIITVVVNIDIIFGCPATVRIALPVVGLRPIASGAMRDGLDIWVWLTKSMVWRNCLNQNFNNKPV